MRYKLIRAFGMMPVRIFLLILATPFALLSSLAACVSVLCDRIAGEIKAVLDIHRAEVMRREKESRATQRTLKDIESL